MEAIRKILMNATDITMAQQYNTHVRAEYAGSPMPPPLTPVPEPIYDTQVWNFRLDLVTNFYVRKDTLQGVEKGDIVANIMYEGIVVLEYSPIVEQTLKIALNNK